MNRILKLLVLGVLVAPMGAIAQKTPWPLNISVFNESTTIPFTTFFTLPVHPGLQVGTEFNYRIKTRTRFFQTVNVNYFFHRHLAHGISLNTELGYEYRMKSGFAFTGLLGLGYLHTFATTAEYDFVNGVYEPAPDRGNARLYPSLSLDVGYYLKRKEASSSKLFIRYQSWAEYPYSPGFIPVMTHVNVHLGVKIVLHQKD